MEPHMLMARAEAQRWVGIAEKLLTTHDLVGSKTFAIRARESDPRLEAANQILAITDTLLAAEQVIIGNNGSQQPDLYGILQLDRFDQNTHNITLQYHRLALILNPNHNHFPNSDQAFHLVNNAWTVLSNPIRKSIYDSDLGFTPHHHHHHQHQHQHQHNFLSLDHLQSPDPNQFQHRIFLSPSQVNLNTVNVREPEPEPHAEPEPEHETETELAEEDVDVDMDDSPTFWTTCPYCFYMYEHHRVYVNCTLRCDNCKRAYQAVRISSPPPIIQGQEAYFCSWGFFPIGVSMAHLQKRNDSNWMPFSTFCDVSSNVKEHRAAHKGAFVNKNLGPRVYIDDEIDDIFVGVSEPSDDDSDTEWNNNSSKRKKVKRMNTRLKLGRKQKAQVLDTNVQVVETSQKDTGVNTRRRQQSKELGKLDLNVEFNNNEGEEPATMRTTSGNRGNGQRDEDNIEGNGFFEGLDEFLNSLPILSVVNEEKVKAG